MQSQQQIATFNASNKLRPISPPLSGSSPNQSTASESRAVSRNSSSMQPFKNSAYNRTASDMKRVCYFRMDPKTSIRLTGVDGNLCTHVILAFVRINADSQLVVASETDYSYLSEVAEFKRRFPNVRVMVSVFNEPEFNGFPRLAAPSNNSDDRLKFARSVMDFLQKYHLDGLDLDWEFPNYPTSFMVSREHERVGFTKILKSLRSAIVENFFDRQLAEQHQMSSLNSASIASRASNTNTEFHVEPYLLTVAIGGQEAILRSSYELKQMSNLCDWLNVMSYDYFLFKAYSPFTGPNSPLYPIVESYVPILNKLSLSWTANKLLEEGLDESKLVMGIPCYARAYRLLFKNTQAAPFTLSAGPQAGKIEDHLNYREVLDVLKREDTVTEFDPRARVPYLLTDSGYLWISYENEQSVSEKVRYILDAGLGGYMTWNLNSDDYIGSSGRDGTSSNGTETAITGARQEPSTFPLHRAMLTEVHRFFKETN